MTRRRRRAIRVRVHAATALLVASIALPGALHADELQLRREATTVVGTTVAVGDAGVQFQPRGSEPILYTWDRVRSLASTDADEQAAFDAYREFADAAWRARTRVERGDFAMAEPLLVDLFEKTRGRTDATALVVAEGLLRARLARSEYTEAIIPWLETFRLLDAGFERVAYRERPGALDERTGLCPSLPPMWSPSPSLDELIARLDAYEPMGSPATISLATLYLAGARQASGESIELPALARLADETMDGRDAVAIVWSFLVGVGGDEFEGVDSSARDAAIRSLDRLVRADGDLPSWRLFARGSSLARSPEDDVAKDGLLDLLTIPASLGEVDPYLAGYALSIAAARLEALGEPDAAASLRRELGRRYPNHPARPANARADQTTPASSTLATNDRLSETDS
ncbi:MAG: hypothetical protein ACF8PN_05410 [Phycisphaerales bacterium]